MAIKKIDFPKNLIIDNDKICGKWIKGDLKSQFGIKVLRIDRGSPWQNGIIERFFGALIKKLLYRIPINDQDQIRQICFTFLKYYNRIRHHQGINDRIPSEFMAESPIPKKVLDLKTVKYKNIQHMDGLFIGVELVA